MRIRPGRHTLLWASHGSLARSDSNCCMQAGHTMLKWTKCEKHGETEGRPAPEDGHSARDQGVHACRDGSDWVDWRRASLNLYGSIFNL